MVREFVIVKQKKLFLFLSFALCLFFSEMLLAQQNQDASQSSEYSFHLGPYLPNQIEGVTEILPTWGLRYGLKSGAKVIEFGLSNARAKGTIYNIASVGLRGQLPLEDLFALFTIGLDAHYYLPPQEKEYRFVGGTHLGSGIMAEVGPGIWLRTDMKFTFNPGVALYFGFGFMFGSPTMDSKEDPTDPTK